MEQDNPIVMSEQTKVGKFLGWAVGIVFSISIFSVFDKSGGLSGLWFGLIGILLLPPINMRLRKIFQDSVKKREGDKYNEQKTNYKYSGLKVLVFTILLFVFALGSPDSTQTVNNTNLSQTSVSSNEEPQKVEKSIPIEYRNALFSAKTYSNEMHMSKKAIFDQLVSEYGNQFSQEAAQYAVDNLKANYNENALKSAEVYSKEMHMSKKAIFDQLVSEYGNKFTASEAQYAIDHMEQ